MGFSKDYDGYFILRWLLDNGVNPNIIMSGNKIMAIDVTSLRIQFRDNLNYNLQTPAKWHEPFGLSGIGKVLSPHKFNGVM